MRMSFGVGAVISTIRRITCRGVWNPDTALFWYQKAADQGGYFDRSQITELQKRVICNQIGHYKRPADRSIIG
jgi:hypothetical protein